MVWISIIVSLLIMNAIIGYIHIKLYVQEFMIFRRKGKVLVGRQLNIFLGIAVVMFQIENDGTILSAKYSVGFALFPIFENWVFPVGRNLNDLTYFHDEITKTDRRIFGAVKQAINTWNIYQNSIF